LSTERTGADSPGTVDPPADAEPGPEAVRLIRDVDTLKAISDPTRMRILETMVQRLEPPWAVKELAARLGVPQTRLYHHVELLADHDLIRPAERRVVSGIIETRYRIAARSFQLDRSLFAGQTEAARQAVHETVAAVFDTARAEVELAINSEAIDPAPDAPPERRVLLSRGVARLSPPRVAELRSRLLALAEEFGDDDDPGGLPFGVVLAVYPLPAEPAAEPTDD
jgi:DNA-binding transcriptional ArsR family regulator